MTIPAKGSRRIRVDDVDYTWRIRKSPTYAQGAFLAPMRVAIQMCAAGPRSVLVVDMKISRPDNWLKPHQTAVTPSVIRDIVIKALVAGWTPDRAGPPVTLEYGLIEDSVSQPSSGRAHR